MPLRDHFHPPLSQRRHWESFHGLWAGQIVRTLNRRILGTGHFAEAQIHVGSRVEEDVGTFAGDAPESASSGNGHGGGVAVPTWTPPATTLTMPAVFPDEIEVQVFADAGGAILVGAIEFISPGNKDRPETRRAFAAKCAAYLQQGIGLVIVDIVTARHANLHDELIGLLDQAPAYRFPTETPLYAVSYRPSRRPSGDQIDLWLHGLAVGQPLPTVPLPLRGANAVPVDLEESYAEVCLDTRVV